MNDIVLPSDIEEICRVFLSGLKNALGEKLFGVYLYGARVFDEGGYGGDIDIHVIVRDQLNDEEETQLLEMHQSLVFDHPPLGAELDCYYILLEDARETLLPQHQLYPDIYDHSWALHCEHMRAGRCIVLYGPDPKEVFPAASWPELDEALQWELDFVEDSLGRYPDYCVLNLCRIMYSYQTKDVVISKRTSAEWAMDKYPDWTPLIQAALKSYDRKATKKEQELLKSQVVDFFDFASEKIDER
jgi:hypothetical protein